MRRTCPHADVCGLHGRPVWGRGDPTSRIMIVGEAPGRNEDKKGVPFVGKAGQELDQYLSRWARVAREACYVTNICHCWPGAGDPDPTPLQIAVCTAAYLQDELARVRPAFIVACGGIAAKWFLGDDTQMEKVHGFAYPWGSAKVIPVYHPAYGLHATPKMRFIQADFMAVGRVIRGAQGMKAVDDGEVDYALEEA